VKTLKVLVVPATILMLVAVIGFGIARAGVTDSPDVLALTSPIDMDFAWADGNSHPDMDFAWADGNSHPDMDFAWADGSPYPGLAQARGPVETGAIQGEALEGSWMKTYGND
jgi:hypothetical protein